MFEYLLILKGFIFLLFNLQDNSTYKDNYLTKNKEIKKEDIDLGIRIGHGEISWFIDGILLFRSPKPFILIALSALVFCHIFTKYIFDYYLYVSTFSLLYFQIGDRRKLFALLLLDIIIFCTVDLTNYSGIVLLMEILMCIRFFFFNYVSVLSF